MRAAALAFLVATGLATASPARAADSDAPPAPSLAAPPPAEPATSPAAGAPSMPPPGAPPSVSRPPKAFPKLRQASLLHKNQLGIAMLPGVGYRGIFPYAKENNDVIPCGQQGKRVCTGMVPFFIDVQPSLGVAPNRGGQRDRGVG